MNVFDLFDTPISDVIDNNTNIIEDIVDSEYREFYYKAIEFFKNFSSKRDDLYEEFPSFIKEISAFFESVREGSEIKEYPLELDIPFCDKLFHLKKENIDNFRKLSLILLNEEGLIFTWRVDNIFHIFEFMEETKKITFLYENDKFHIQFNYDIRDIPKNNPFLFTPSLSEDIFNFQYKSFRINVKKDYYEKIKITAISELNAEIFPIFCVFVAKTQDLLEKVKVVKDAK